MNIKKQSWLTRFSGVSSLVLATLVLGIAEPAQSQPPNQSDTSGTNIYNPVTPGYLFEPGEELDEAVLAEAQRLSEALDEAYAACVASTEAAVQVPRRFSVRNAPADVCSTAECAAYATLLQEAQQFLAETEADVAEFSPGYRVW